MKRQATGYRCACTHGRPHLARGLRETREERPVDANARMHHRWDHCIQQTNNHSCLQHQKTPPERSGYWNNATTGHTRKTRTTHREKRNKRYSMRDGSRHIVLRIPQGVGFIDSIQKWRGEDDRAGSGGCRLTDMEDAPRHSIGGAAPIE